MTDYIPTWKERQGYGPTLTDVEIARHVFEAPEGGGGDWRHIAVVATIISENLSRAWARPIVFDPTSKYHLSVDRGICAFNSARDDDGTPLSHWAGIPDHIAYNPQAAIREMVAWLHREGIKRTRGATPWSWTRLLAWQWNAYGTEDYEDKALPRARQAMELVRAEHGLGPVPT